MIPRHLARRALALLLFLVASFAARSGFADPPSWSQLFPPGGQAGEVVEVTIRGGKFSHWPPGISVEPPGTLEVTPGEKKGTLRIACPALESPRTSWIRLHDAEGATSFRPFRVSPVATQLEKESNDTPGTATLVSTTPAIIHGALDRSQDVDGFAIDLERDEILVADLEARRSLGSPLDAVLQLVDERGFVLVQNHDDSTLDPRLIYRARRPGRHVLRVFGFPLTPNSSISLFSNQEAIYRLTLTRGPFVDHVQPLALTIPEGDELSASLELRGWNLEKKTLELAGLTAPDSLPGEVHHVEVPAPGPVQPVLRLEPHPVVRVRDLDRSQGPPTIRPPVSLSGELVTPGQHDQFLIAGKKGERFRIELHSRRLGALSDPVLEIQAPSGKSRGRFDDPARYEFDPETRLTLEEDGAHLIEVYELHERGGLRHPYLLRVLPGEEPPDFQPTLATDRFRLEVGKPLEIVVKIERRGGHEAPIRLEATGLPEGVRQRVPEAATPESPPGEKSKNQKPEKHPAELRLELEASPGASSGAFEILARDENGLRRAVRTPIPGLLPGDSRRGPEHRLFLTVVEQTAKEKN